MRVEARGCELEPADFLFRLGEAVLGGAVVGFQAAGGPDGDVERGADGIGGGGAVRAGAGEAVVPGGGELGPAFAADAFGFLLSDFDALFGGADIGADAFGCEFQAGFDEFAGDGAAEEFGEGGVEQAQFLFGGDDGELFGVALLAVAGEIELAGGAGLFLFGDLIEQRFGDLEARLGGLDAALGLEGLEVEGHDGGLGLFAGLVDVEPGRGGLEAAGADGGEEGEIEHLLRDDRAGVEGAVGADAVGEAGEGEADALEILGLIGAADDDVGLGEIVGFGGHGLGFAFERAEAGDLDAGVLAGGEVEGRFKGQRLSRAQTHE